jgi:hypothetical protein
LCDNDIFVFATKNYLASLDNPESGKALNLLGVWTDTWPDASEELADGLDEAVQSVKFILLIGGLAMLLIGLGVFLCT